MTSPSTPLSRVSVGQLVSSFIVFFASDPAGLVLLRLLFLCVSAFLFFLPYLLLLVSQDLFDTFPALLPVSLWVGFLFLICFSLSRLISAGLGRPPRIDLSLRPSRISRRTEDRKESDQKKTSASSSSSSRLRSPQDFRSQAACSPICLCKASQVHDDDDDDDDGNDDDDDDDCEEEDVQNGSR